MGNRIILIVLLIVIIVFGCHRRTNIENQEKTWNNRIKEFIDQEKRQNHNNLRANHELAKIKALPTLEQKGDSVYWSMVKEGIQIIPDLIENLDNNQNTSIPVYIFGGTYTISDICYQMITDIIPEIPTLKLIRKSGCTDPDNGFWNYWLYLRKDTTNRKHFKKVVNDWFICNRNRLIWFKTIDHKYQSEDNTFINPAGGYYKLNM